jgi:hypothetical protein
MNHQDIVDRFYQALGKRDGETMARCYANQATFSDPAFPNLDAKEVRGMWRMLCSRSTDLKVDYTVRKIDDKHFEVDWNAYYTFTKTGRKVHNIIRADIFLDQGLIVKHRDRFDFWRWSRQALGLPGLLLGWTPILRGSVQKQARQNLEQFMQKHG